MKDPTKETGKPPITYLNEVRMREAARRLMESNLPVNQIAAQVGILDTNYFIKLFKRTLFHQAVQTHLWANPSGLPAQPPYLKGPAA